MKRKRKLVRRILCAALFLALLLPLSGPAMVLPASAVTQAEIDDLKDDAADLEAQREALEEQLDSIRADKSRALEQKDLLEQQINATQAEIDNIQAQIDAYTQLIAEKEVELAQAEDQEAELYDQFCQRVRYMEEEGEVSYWSILFSSSDFSDLLDNFMMVEEFIAYDNRLMDEILALQDQIRADQEELETAKAEQETARGEQE